MADDTRQRQTDEDLSKEALTVDKEYVPFSGEQWKDAKKHNRPASANMLEGASSNTAGGKLPEVTLSNVFEGGIKLSDFTELPTKPCVREALLTGLGAGFALGGVRGVFGASLFSACSWAVTGICASSGVQYQWCLYKRQKEKEGMMRAVEILSRKDIEKKAREAQKERQREERRKAKEEELEGQYSKLREASGSKTDGGESKSWWKVW